MTQTVKMNEPFSPVRLVSDVLSRRFPGNHQMSFQPMCCRKQWLTDELVNVLCLQGLMKRFFGGFLISISLPVTDLECLIENLIFNSLKLRSRLRIEVRPTENDLTRLYKNGDISVVITCTVCLLDFGRVLFQ